MTLLYLILFFTLLVAGILMVPFTLPGTWLMVAAAGGYALVRDFQSSSDLRVLLIAAGLAAFAEIVEFLIGTLGSKKAHVPNGAIVASMVGGILGAIIGVPIFLIGALLGLFLGTFLGAFIYMLMVDGEIPLALKNATVVLTSRVISVFAKTAIAIGMGVYLVLKAV